LLDGSRSLAEIIKIAEMSRSEAEGIIDYLNQLDVLEDNYSTAFDYYTDIYAPAFKAKQLPTEQVINKKIYILGDETLGLKIKENLVSNAMLVQVEIVNQHSSYMEILTNSNDSWLYNALQFEEIAHKFNQFKDGFIILASDSINPVLAKRFNRIAHSLEIDWLHAAIDGPFIFIGPTFEAQQTACYECFETRVAINLREYGSYQKYKNAIANNQIVRKAEFPMQGLLRNLMISHLSLEVFNFILTACNFTKNKVMSIYLPTMEINFNEFLKVANCEACGTQVHRDDHQLYFDVQGLLQGGS
jgi:thiazole/oxazole-forming peptide maturase SagC family component